MIEYCRLCQRPMSGSWAELAAREAADGKASETPLETNCVEHCWGCLREIEQGIPDPRPLPRDLPAGQLPENDE